MLSAIASIYQGKDTAGINKMLEEVVDPAGTFYRFGMADSMLKRKRLQKS
jgi:F420-non-reducing hydrogenase small subunit